MTNANDRTGFRTTSVVVLVVLVVLFALLLWPPFPLCPLW